MIKTMLIDDTLMFYLLLNSVCTASGSSLFLTLPPSKLTGGGQEAGRGHDQADDLNKLKRDSRP